MIFNVNGDIVNNDDSEFYAWFGWDCTCPKQIRNALNKLEAGEKLELKINSGGGDVFAGKEIYSVLRGRDDVEIEVESLAGSAASIIAMAGHCLMSPVATMMIHNVSMYGAAGDYRDMDKYSEILREENEALAAAYVEKTGKELDEILEMMDKETWLTASQAVEYGFADGITEAKASISNAQHGMRLTDELREKAKAEMHDAEVRRQLAEARAEIIKDLDRFGI